MQPLSAYCLACERTEPVLIGDASRQQKHIVHFRDVRRERGRTFEGYAQFPVICARDFVTVNPSSYVRNVAVTDWHLVTCKDCLSRK